MIAFFRAPSGKIYATGITHAPATADLEKLVWLFGNAQFIQDQELEGPFIGPRKEMITPWSTNAVEITQTMGISGISRIEEFFPAAETTGFDPMLQARYARLDQQLFTINRQPEPIRPIEDIAEYNRAEGLALNEEEVAYLEAVSRQIGRPLTDSEVFGFSQINSEHCRHKIFNGTFVIDGREKAQTLFQLIKETARKNPNLLVSAYKDNVAFISGPRVTQFAPLRQDIPDYFVVTDIDTVLSLKAETHNFPTTVEPFNGAATGSGGEIRDRLAGGRGSVPLAGTAVYITSYPRVGDHPWEKNIKERKWLYHNPQEILTRASDGASDFGNKFGQPLIAGSLLTFEHEENGKVYGYDKVIMLAGGIGYGRKEASTKNSLKAGDKIVLLGGDNYRIGMGGGAVSSVDTGQFGNTIELNAVQRSNPEMQKRVMNAIRALAEMPDNPIISIHDHGAGGHLNCYSELLEETGGTIHLDKLPVGDPTLSDKEILSNESQERMGLAIAEEHIRLVEEIAKREKAPFYVVGEAGNNKRLVFDKSGQREKPFDLELNHLFGSSPKTILTDTTQQPDFSAPAYDTEKIQEYLVRVLKLEAVACKDWLTNKVDRCVTGKVATQQTCGKIQLPLNNVGVMTVSYGSTVGVATAIGHAPVAGLADPAAGSRLSIAESLTNLVWASLKHGLKGVSLSANWMWPAKNPGENARLYSAVEAAGEFAVALGVNIPTGKDSMSMTQKYPDGEVVISPGTVIISAIGEVDDVRKTVSPALEPISGTTLIHVDFSGAEPALGGSSLGQVLNGIDKNIPDVKDAQYFSSAFNAVQELIKNELILAGHDISSGGVITAMLEMCFAVPDAGLQVELTKISSDPVKALFNENPGVLLQVADRESVISILNKHKVRFVEAGQVTGDGTVSVTVGKWYERFNVSVLRDQWFETSYLMDAHQRPAAHAAQRFRNYHKQVLDFKFPAGFTGNLKAYGLTHDRRTRSGTKAAIIREKGVNGDREMAYSLHLAGFDVKDVHMTDLFSGREDLSDVNMIVFVGGFSNSDVLGSAKGWAGGFRYNERAKKALADFYRRPDTLSLGVCNGCQLMMALGILYPDLENHPVMHPNGSEKFECTFTSLDIPENNSVMLGGLAGQRLGIWVAHGEGRFILEGDKAQYNPVAYYTYGEYPGNPNDSENHIAALSSADGRHLAIMPHLERSIFPWNWPYYPTALKQTEISPWIEAFINARLWISKATQ